MAKHFLVVGGNSGIGLSTVDLLLGAGHTVTAACRTPGPLPGRGVAVVPFDASEPALDAADLPETLDGLVYFPGTIQLKPFNRLTADDFRRDFQINVLGAVAAIQAARPAVRRAPNASIVLFSTVAVAQGMTFHASIAAAKGAVEGLARSLAAELAPTIRVNLIAPSLTDTPLADGLLNTDAKREAACKRHPLQRVGGAGEVAELVVFLLSDASRSVTGQTFRPDGGMSSVRLFS
jgi:NAD(P)-dependent dehydrogenase (short-subunit alcohol dehydrogenase family)